MEKTLYYKMKLHESIKTEASYKDFIISLLSEENAEMNILVPMTLAEDCRNLYSFAEYSDGEYLYIACIPGDKLPDDVLFTTSKLCDFLNMVMDDELIKGIYFNPYISDGVIVASDILRMLTGR